MKQLSKIMLAAVASVALAAPAFAWDFSASGTATASFNQTSTQASNGEGVKPSTIGTGFSSEGSGFTLSSSHTEGPNTASFTYALDWDDDMDETLTISGSRKVGEWTASGSVSYDPMLRGCSSSSSQYVSNATYGDNLTAANTGDNGTVSTTTVSATCAGD